MKYKRPFLSVIFMLISLTVLSQTRPATGLNAIVASIDTFRNRLPEEKLYIHFDKPYYSAGDTIWLKAYLFDAAFLTGSVKSGIVYIELANDTNKVLLQRMLPMSQGLGAGNIVLNKDDIPEGSYTLRAYTNLMRNFGEDLVFKKSFYVSSTKGDSWLVNSNVKLGKESGKENVRLGLQFTDISKKALGLYGMDIRVLEGKRVLFRDKVQTDIDGKLDVNFDLPEKTDPRNLSIVAENSVAVVTHKITVPIPVNRSENTDLQFMPEGGNLVADIPSKVGFKAIGEDGKGMEISGKIYSSSGSGEVAVFSSSYKGMGSFEMKPKEGESYTAKVVLSDGTTKSYPLPAVKPAGTTLRIANSAESDSLELTISLSRDLPSATATATISPAPATYYLIGQSRGVVPYGAIIRFTGGNVNYKKVAKSLFPTGIARFTLFNSDNEPINERIVYIDHHDNMEIVVAAEQPVYQTRDSIVLNILVADKDGKPVQGSFSLAVTDDSQVKTDSLSNNILTATLLTSDLKGTIEDPGHYIQTPGDLDNLLLTQGWTGYQWKDIFNPLPIPQYAAEPEFIVKGRVSNVFNKGLEGTNIRLLSSKPELLMDGLTGKEGSFIFAGFPVADTLKFFIQARNKNEKSSNIGIDVEEFKPPVFSRAAQRFNPWYVNSDTTLLGYVKTAAAKQEEEIKLTGGNILNAVTITAKKIVKDSKNLNGAGNADIIMDQKDMDKLKKISLFELLEQRIPGFREVRSASDDNPARYQVYTRGVILFIDGVFIDKNMGQSIGMLLDYLNADDIKGIEVMSSGKYRTKYFQEELSKLKLRKDIEEAFSRNAMNPNIYIEITTWSGHGAYMGKTPGTYLYKPMPFTSIKQFYRPKYANKAGPTKIPDLRSTIHWVPDIVTDKDGKAVVSFYSSDSKGTYTIITEGSDMNGNLGSQKSTIIINP